MIIDFEKMQKLMRSFPNSFINAEGEFIAHKYANQYFILRTCETEFDVKCKVLEWFSRSYKEMPYRSRNQNNEFRTFMRTGINKYLGTKFTEADLCLIYTHLGNACNHEKTIEFVNSGYDLSVLERGD
jgi:hypothetical protein